MARKRQPVPEPQPQIPEGVAAQLADNQQRIENLEQRIATLEQRIAGLLGVSI